MIYIIFKIIVLILCFILFIFAIFKLINPLSCEKSKKIKIFIDCFCNEYTPHIVKYILYSIPNVEIVNNKYDSDINVYHVNNNDYIPGKINIVISGEPDDIKDSVDLYIGPVLKENVNIDTIYYPQMYSSLFEHRKSVNKNNYIKSNKNKFSAYMYRQKHQHRIKYFNLVSQYKKVDALGECCKNTDIPTSRHINNENETYNDIAVDLYKDYKFVLAIENKDMNGYFTEKINNPLIANSIPIYWGNKKVFDYINKKRIIYIPDYTNEELLNVIKRIDNDDIEYKNIINEPWYVNEKTPENIEIQLQKEIKEKITNILNKKILI